MSFLNIDPTLCRGKFTRWEDYSEDWIVEKKENGDRRVAQFCPERTYYTGRRDGINSGNKRDVSACLPALGSAAPVEFHGLVLDGELTVPGGTNSDITEVVGGSAAHAAAVLARPDHRGVRYVTFDILREPGRDLTLYSWEFRRKLLIAWVSRLADAGIGTPPKARIVVSEAHVATAQFSRSFYAGILAEGGEGVVLKYRKSKYADQRFWVKVKPWESVTVRCVGYKMGEGKYDGLIGSLQFTVPETGVRGYCSGMTDAERVWVTLHMDDLIGRMFRLRFTSTLPSGALQHPRFHGWVSPF